MAAICLLFVQDDWSVFFCGQVCQGPAVIVSAYQLCCEWRAYFNGLILALKNWDFAKFAF